MSVPYTHPLNDAHLNDINNALAMLDTADRHLALAKQAGIPGMESVEQQIRGQRDALLKIKQTYFPGR